jgi:type II secretory pathway pseudopilin PulG
MRNKKAFSAVEIILVIVIIGLIGAVGWVFWNNSQKTSNISSANKSNSSTSSSSNNSTAGLKQYNADTSLLGYNFVFQYPADWTVDVNKDNNLPLKITVTSPTKKTQLNYKVGYMVGIGGMCNPDSNDVKKMGVLEDFSYDASIKLNNGQNNIYLVETLFNNNGKVTESKTYLSNRINFMKNEGYCQVYLSEIMKLNPETLRDDKNSWSSLIDTKVVLSDIQNSDGSIKNDITSKNVIDARSTTEYSQAKDIFKSTTYSKL